MPQAFRYGTETNWGLLEGQPPQPRDAGRLCRGTPVGRRRVSRTGGGAPFESPRNPEGVAGWAETDAALGIEGLTAR